MSVNVKEKPTNFVVFDFFGCKFRHPPPPPPSQFQDNQIRDIASSSNIFEHFKFSKMLEEETISQISGFCDCDVENWVTKIAAKKIELTFLIFSVAIFVTQFLPSQSQDPRICDIVSSSNIFGNLPITIARPSNLRYCVFVKQFWEF